MKTVVLANHKGIVCAKTTALNLAIVMACQGSRVLAVDLRPTRQAVRCVRGRFARIGIHALHFAPDDCDSLNLI